MKIIKRDGTEVGFDAAKIVTTGSRHNIASDVGQLYH